MPNYNKVILMGNLTRDPQLSYLPSNTPVVEFGLAINHRWRSQDGQQREDTCFVDCRLYGKQAETFNQYMKKGRPVMVEGRLQLDSWEDKQGNKRSKHRVLVDRFVFVDSQGGGGGGGGQPQQRRSQSPQQSGGHDDSGYDDPSPPPTDDMGGDDIPF